MPVADDHLVGDRKFENRKGQKQKRVKIGHADKRHRVGELWNFPPERGPGRGPGTVGPGPADRLFITRKPPRNLEYFRRFLGDEAGDEYFE